jgi:ankyrin repeat protein
MFLFLYLTVFVLPLFGEDDDGESLNALDANGETALYKAARMNDVEQVNFLLGKGADVNQQGGTGETALMACSEFRTNLDYIHKKREIASLLLDSGADPNLQDMEGDTVMMKIYWSPPSLSSTGEEESAWEELIELLLSAGADPAIKNSRGQTVLHLWYRFMDDSMLDTLIAHGCSIDEPDHKGTTLLMLAAQDEYRWWLITEALERGADPNLRDSEGRTAFHYYLIEVEKRGYREDLDYEIVTSFLAAGARPADTDNKGDSALSAVIRLSDIYIPIRPLRDRMMEHANDDEIKAAELMASKITTKKVWANFGDKVTELLPYILIVLIMGGLSIGMREGVYKKNPSENWMGSVNALLSISAVSTAIGFFALVPATLASNSGSYADQFAGLIPVASGIIGGIVGFWVGMILISVLPSIGKTINKNKLLYYLLTVVNTIFVVLVISFLVLRY